MKSFVIEVKVFSRGNKVEGYCKYFLDFLMHSCVNNRVSFTLSLDRIVMCFKSALNHCGFPLVKNRGEMVLHKKGDLQVKLERNGLLEAMKYASEEWQAIRKRKATT